MDPLPDDEPGGGEAEHLRGKLLVAGASLWDPNFRRCVVIVGEHTDDGALGVVLNRPSSTTVHEAIPELAELVPADEPLFVGGPVQPLAPVVLADVESRDLADVPVLGSIGFLTGDVRGPEGIRRARVFAGYAGWGPGQLEQELREGSWIVEPARSEDVFTADPGGLWSRVLRRKGPEYGILALMPDDPAAN
jgi:putative transcriptional regulator